jgi:hypothetical protein
MISSVTVVARPRETTKRIGTEGRKDRKGLAPIGRASPNITKVRNGPAGFSNACLCDLRVLL